MYLGVGVNVGGLEKNGLAHFFWQIYMYSQTFNFYTTK